MQYEFEVKEINYGYLKIEANSREEAKEKSIEEYEKGNVLWNNSDVSTILIGGF